MSTVAQAESNRRLAALREERDDLNERMQDLIDEATHHATVGRMDRWAATRERLSAEADRLTIVNEQIARLELGRGSRATEPSRTQSWAVER
ncbi:MAG: hypothetical protein M0R28_21505 [Pigmentiphaga sp.]|nr:hypothetical protein [Pigmentiphaga sp.]